MTIMHTVKMIGFGFLSAALGIILLVNQYVMKSPYQYLGTIVAASMILVAAFTMLCSSGIKVKIADFFLTILGLLLLLVPIFNSVYFSTPVIAVVILLVGIIEIVIGFTMA